jgi:CBS domain containing-hemolysin-like protein
MLEIDLPYEQAHTVGGLVMDRLGRIPKVGDKVEVGGVSLRVEEVAHHSVTRVCVSLRTEGRA